MSLRLPKVRVEAEAPSIPFSGDVQPWSAGGQTRSGPGREALFNLTNGPYEQTNLALRPGYEAQLEKMRARHAELALTLK